MAPIRVEDHDDLPYPRERIPKHAVLSAASLLSRSSGAIPAIDDADDVRYANRGCMAIGLALEHARIGAGDEVLLPAYHCISMVEPVAWRNARPVFYRIRPDTSVDIDDVRSRLTPRTRALLVTHYFGFLQQLEAIRAFCDERSIVLIEDCAHAYFGSTGGVPVGSTGDYAIASAWKFFPVWDGGVLVSRRHSLGGVALESGNLRFQAKAFVNTLEQAFEYRRMNVLRVLLQAPLRLKDAVLRRKRAAHPGPAEATGLSRRLGGWGFDAAIVRREMSLSSRSLVAMVSRRRIAEGRRENYRRMESALGQLRGCRPLFAALPEGVVPQVFPLVVDAPERVFPALKKAGVPVIRFGEFLWEGMDPEVCPVSADLSRRVFQLPCHQELTEAEIEWMLGAVRSAVLPG
jgi:dTDP-4-amino-4,6-dideoxygalactose transaminase